MTTPDALPDLRTALTLNQRRSVRRRNVGSLDDGRAAFLVRPGDTETMALAVLDAYDPDLVLAGRIVVEWCVHSADYAYRHGCGDWCDNPSPRMVWVARLRDTPAPDVEDPRA